MALEPSGHLPRVETLREDRKPLETALGPVPVAVSRAGEVSGLPDRQSGVTLIVSRMVAEAAPDRRDLVFPLDLIRDDKGRVIGCASLGMAPTPAVLCYQCGDTGLYIAGDFGGSGCICPCPAGRKYEAEVAATRLRTEGSVP